MSPQIGKKILVVGVMAAGKSTFSRKLAEKLHLPVVFADSIMWKPGWNLVSDEETAKKLDEATSGPEWVLEGYIVKKARPVVCERADTILYLDYPWHVISFRYLKRWWKHRKHPRPELPGSPERFEFKFLKLAWRKSELGHMREFIEGSGYTGKVLVLKSPKQAQKFLQELPA